MVQSVLSLIPIYSLSFHQIPKNTIHELIKLQRSFLWGGSEANSKIPWVRWSDICKSKEEGSLGIKDLDIFNKSLLGKWVWRLFDEKHSLWVRVLGSLYGGLEESSLAVVNGRGLARFSLWWRDLCRLFWGSNGDGLRTDFSRKLGKGNDTIFLHDLWVNGGDFKTYIS